MLHGVRHTDSTDQQRRQPDQREILRESLDVASKAGRRIGACAHLPAGIGELLFGRRDDRIRRTVVGVAVADAQAIVPAHQAAGLDEAARAQRRLADHQARTKADAAGELVGLGLERGAQFDRCGADGDARARL